MVAWNSEEQQPVLHCFRKCNTAGKRSNLHATLSVLVLLDNARCFQDLSYEFINSFATLINMVNTFKVIDGTDVICHAHATGGMWPPTRIIVICYVYVLVIKDEPSKRKDSRSEGNAECTLLTAQPQEFCAIVAWVTAHTMNNFPGLRVNGPGKSAPCSPTGLVPEDSFVSG